MNNLRSAPALTGCTAQDTTTVRVLALTLIATAAALAGCGSEPAGAGSAAPAGSGVAAPKSAGAGKSTAATPAAPAAPAKVELEESKNDKMGYSIKIPKGAKTEMADQNGGMYGYDTMVIKVDPVAQPLAKEDDLLRGVNIDGATVDKKQEGDVLIAIVTKPSSPLSVFAGPKGAKFAAQCMSEPQHKELALQICPSIQALKK
jgi:hypothetical protein